MKKIFIFLTLCAIFTSTLSAHAAKPDFLKFNKKKAINPTIDDGTADSSNDYQFTASATDGESILIQIQMYCNNTTLEKLLTKGSKFKIVGATDAINPDDIPSGKCGLYGVNILKAEKDATLTSIQDINGITTAMGKLTTSKVLLTGDSISGIVLKLNIRGKNYQFTNDGGPIQNSTKRFKLAGKFTVN